LLYHVTKQSFEPGTEPQRSKILNKNKILLIAGAAVAVAIGLVFVIRTNSSTSTKDVQGAIATRSTQTAINNLNPFTNVASIPAIVDPATIRFEKLKMVELASKTKTTNDPAKCKDQQFREPDGSTCQTVAVLERVKAVEARYSYNGPVLSAGETIPGRDQFTVYFRPEELASAGPVEKLNREQAESLFELTTSRPMVEEKVIDKAHSQFCDGNYVDGSWTRKDPNCQDQVQYMTQTVPSPNLLVQVELRRPTRLSAGGSN
jgi:hypothetical protein